MTISRPIQIFALVGLLAVVGLGATLALGRARTTSTPAQTQTATTQAASTTASDAASNNPTVTVSSAPATPHVKLLPGVPAAIAHALQTHRTVVVTLYEGGDSDRLALAEARAGASAAHTDFVGVNVLTARDTAAIASFAGTLAEPATLVVSRPGRVVRLFTGVQDRLVIAQAAHDAR
jgi:hypothetical protein